MPSLKTRVLHALAEQQASAARVAALEETVEVIEESVGSLETNIGDADIGAVVVTVDGFTFTLADLDARIAALETP